MPDLLAVHAISGCVAATYMISKTVALNGHRLDLLGDDREAVAELFRAPMCRTLIP